MVPNQFQLIVGVFPLTYPMVDTMKSCVVKSGKKIIKSVSNINVKKEELQIKLAEKIIGSCVVELEFQGILNDRLLGFYRSKYEQNGKPNILPLHNLKQQMLDVHFHVGMSLKLRPLLKFQLLLRTNSLQYLTCL